MNPSANLTLALTKEEAQLRSLLLDVTRAINESKGIEDVTQLRWAGGWVRDKLLGIASNDIDIAINTMTGEAFSDHAKKFLSDQSNLDKYGLNHDDIANIHKIAANPDKSKHLETVTTRLLGFDLDFVNLRKETYTEDSRNPQMEFGSPKEDALRRDATINALFYNLDSGKIEDFTGGIADLNQKRIRTPLDPHQTFLDDPLRVLRLIRFASRLDFEIDGITAQEMSNPVILNALGKKISRERIGVELEKMLKESDQKKVLRACILIDELDLYSTIFTDPTGKETPKPDTSSWQLAYNTFYYLKESFGSFYETLSYSGGLSHDYFQRQKESSLLAWTLCTLAPLYHMSQSSNTNSKKLAVPLGAAVAREGIKRPSRTVNIVSAAFRNREQISAIKHAIVDGQIVAADTLGMRIRQWDRDGGWRFQVLFAIFVDCMENLTATSSKSCPPEMPMSSSLMKQERDVLLSHWQKFIDYLAQNDLLTAETLKPLVDGLTLQRELGAKPGKWMAPALDICLAWQFRHRGETNIDIPIQEVRNRAEELQIPFISKK